MELEEQAANNVPEFESDPEQPKREKPPGIIKRPKPEGSDERKGPRRGVSFDPLALLLVFLINHLIKYQYSKGLG